MTNLLKRAGAFCAGVVAVLSTASAQITYTSANADTAAANAAFPPQNAFGPTGANYQVNYPYPGQCRADPANNLLFPTLLPCTSGSFACANGLPSRTAGGWAACDTVVTFKELAPIVPNSAVVAGAVATPKFVWEVLNPPAYTPDTTTFPGADYYEIALHEAWGFQDLATLGAFPNPLIGRCSLSLVTCDPTVTTPPLGCGACNPVFPGAPPVPGGMQWTGLTCNVTTGCSCPADAADVPGGINFKTKYCSAGSKVPYGYPLYTPIWGVGQKNGAPLGLPANQTAAPWSPGQQYFATWPSISIRANRGTPVVVKWVNEFPNNHVLCPHPDAADWPCSIDRTFMGVKTRIDPGALQGMNVPADGVNPYGSPQQPDNSWVTHLHGGEIPPSTDGFAELWFGNAATAAVYNTADPLGQGKLVNPPFENPSSIALRRPVGNSATYTYPMVQEEATIWFHDHTLGKTHHNVIAGPAGFFPVKEPLKHGKVAAGTCTASAGTCDYTWLDPVTEPLGALGIPKYDLFFAIQDRAFNTDGSLNFSNGLGQTVPQPPLVPGTTAVTPGVNPLVHPTWVPEYFGDHALVNGVLWPRKSTEPGWYRIRVVDGSDSRCWTLGFQRSPLAPAPGTAVNFNVPFYVIASDQGYYRNPVLAPRNRFTMCPGERYELLVNFGQLPGVAAGAATPVWMVNNAPAPFPAGITPQAAASPFAEMNVVMMFDVNPVFGPGVKSCGQTQVVGKVATPVAPATLSWDPATPAANLATSTGVGTPILAGNYLNICMPANPAVQPVAFQNLFKDLRPAAWPLPAGTKAIARQVYLNERVDGVTLAPMGMQLNGVPFEYKVTETPKLGSTEYWQFINLTVDAHPMHPHLIKHQIVARQNFSVGGYKRLLCGSATCQPGPTPGGEMQVIPDVTPLLTGAPTLVTAASVDGGFKDATQALPGMVTTIVAEWTARWNTAGGTAAPGTAGCPNGTPGCGAPYFYEPVISGPYVWHCHINSHEDSEMMRTSLVVQ